MSFLFYLVQLLLLLVLLAFPFGRFGDHAPLLEKCPDCGGDIVETSGDGCCGGFGPGGPTRVLACRECGQRLATIE